MKKLITVTTFVLMAILVFAQEKVNLTINFKCINGRSGFEYDAKLVVLQDGLPIGESPTKFQTEKNSVTVKVKKGNATIRAILYAKVKDEWEARTKENNWSKDWDFIEQKDWTKNETIDLTFDISNEKILKGQKPISTVSKVNQTYTNSSEFLDTTPSEKSKNKKKDDDDDWIDEDFDELANVAPKINTTINTSNYQSELKKLNDYLKTFDNGYYGYFEVKDNDIYIRLKDGNYCTASINDLDKAYAIEDNKKVHLKCLNGENCMTATYTKGKTVGLTMYDSKPFNPNELIALINNFLDARRGNQSVKNTNTSTLISSGNYQTALKKLNEYLKTFDNGYYGYLEIKDGYLYDRFPSGKYTKTLMSDLSKAEEETYKKKVRILCKNNKDCVFSTYTDSYHKQISFSQTTDFNTSELITLLNNLINTYNKPSTSNNSNQNDIDDATEKARLERLKLSNSVTQTNNISSTTSTIKYAAALQKLNDYLKKFDGGYYGSLEVVDGYLYDRFKNGKDYCKAKVSDLQSATEVDKNTKVDINCKDNKDCVYSTFTDKNHSSFTFSQNTEFDSKILIGLIDNFLNAYNGKTTTDAPQNIKSTERIEETKKRLENKVIEETEDSEDWDALAYALGYEEGEDLDESASDLQNKTSEASKVQKYAVALQKLNDYLPKFNKEVYKNVEVKNGDVYFHFYVYGAVYSSKISISKLKEMTNVVSSPSDKKIKIVCKNEANHFYSTYNKSYNDHFQFYSYSVSEFNTIKKLVEDFINAL
jgi:hypothetical protein